MQFERLEARRLFAAATIETTPVPSGGDAADDVAIWVHPTDSSLSTIIGTDKGGGIAVYGLDGRQLSYRDDGAMNNVDLRYNFPLNGNLVTLVAATNRTDDTIALYTVDPATRALQRVGSVQTDMSDVYGVAMYHSHVSGKFYVIVSDHDGHVDQWEMSEARDGRVTGTLVRSFDVGSVSEGLVADDEAGVLYVAEESRGIWKYGAEPGAAAEDRVLVDEVDNGRLHADVEGVAIYQAADGAGYLIASSQGDSTFAIYDRQTNAYVGKFTVGTTGMKRRGIDKVTGTDGIEVSSFGLGDWFSKGVFVAQDTENDRGHQNFKLVRWQDVATKNGLLVDTTQDPRTPFVALPPPLPPLPRGEPPPDPAGAEDDLLIELQ